MVVCSIVFIVFMGFFGSFGFDIVGLGFEFMFLEGEKLGFCG